MENMVITRRNVQAMKPASYEVETLPVVPVLSLLVVIEIAVSFTKSITGNADAYRAMIVDDIAKIFKRWLFGPL
jgi:hypothetical protein